LRKNTVLATALFALLLGLLTPNVSEAKPLSGKVVASVPALLSISEVSSSSHPVSSASVETQARERKIQSAISKTYKFGERSDSVRNLQSLLWNVKVDGYYGSATRNAHIYALSTRDMSIKHVPAVVYKTSTGPRFPSDKTLRCPKWEAKFREYGLPVEVFSYIAYRESKCNPKAVNARWNSKGQLTYTLNNNGTWDSGLVQINSSWVSAVREVCKVDTGSFRRDLEALLKVDCNLKVAKWIMENSSGKLRNWSIYGGQ
jgi:hypothetical protein